MPNRDELEQTLGCPRSFVLSTENERTLREWAISVGYEPDRAYSMSAVALANVYAGSVKLIDVQLETAKAVMLALQVTKPKPSPPPKPSPKFIHYMTPLIHHCVSLNHPVMMVGPAGCGKTTIGEHVADHIELPFHITNCVTDTHELMGYMDGYGNYHSTSFRTAFEQGGVWIADEIDAWEASALLACNSALANGYANFPDSKDIVRRHDDFRVIATANTYGFGSDRIYVGRNELDGASLDRFATIDVDYDIDLERYLAGDQHTWLEYVWDIRKNVRAKKIRHVVSTRAIKMGSEALASGMHWDIVKETYLFKGMNASDRKKVDD